MRVLNISSLPGSNASLRVYLRERTYEHVIHDKRPLIMIFPGGGYSWLADREAEPVAIAFVKHGFQACVVNYSVRHNEEGPFLGDQPMQDAAAAIFYARTHAEEWGIDPNKITVIGFSAGGHAAGSIGVFWNDKKRIPNGGELAKPNAMILCYAVLTASAKTHSGSIMNLSGSMPGTEKAMSWSLEKHVSNDTCPAFIWHTSEDDCVPVEGALLMANAMQEQKRPYALHIFTHGWHGLSLVTPEVGGGPAECLPWFSLALDWLASMGLSTNYQQ